MKKKLIAIIITASLFSEIGAEVYAVDYNDTTGYTYSGQNDGTNTNGTNTTRKAILRKKGLIRYLFDGGYDNFPDGVKSFFLQAYGDNTNNNIKGNSLTGQDLNLDIGDSIKEDEDDKNPTSTTEDAQNTPQVPQVTGSGETTDNSQVVPQTPAQTPQTTPVVPAPVQTPQQPEQNIIAQQPQTTTPSQEQATKTPAQPSKSGTTAPGTTQNQTQNPTSPSTNTSDKFMEQVEQLVFARVNQERAKAGAAKLSYSSTMEKYARIKSQDMGDRAYFRHEDPAGNLITVRMQKDGVTYSAWGENIAYIGGVSDANALATQFMNNWMNSPGHRANILSTKFTGIGVGVYRVGNKVYATQEFIR